MKALYVVTAVTTDTKGCNCQMCHKVITLLFLTYWLPTFKTRYTSVWRKNFHLSIN